MDISEILSSLSPDDMEQLKNAANSILGGGQAKQESLSPAASPFDASMLGNLGKISQALSGDDDRTALLKALKPMLSEPRRQKADEAIKILKLIGLLPLLKDSGLLKGLL